MQDGSLSVLLSNIQCSLIRQMSPTQLHARLQEREQRRSVDGQWPFIVTDLSLWAVSHH